MVAITLPDGTPRPTVLHAAAGAVFVALQDIDHINPTRKWFAEGMAAEQELANLNNSVWKDDGMGNLIPQVDAAEALYFSFMATAQMRLATRPMTVYSGSRPLLKKKEKFGAKASTSMPRAR